MKLNGVPAVLALFALFLFSCTKINEATELGDDLIPAVDNVNTFDTTLDVQAAYFPFDDSSRHLITDNMALGQLTDPAFGNTTADMYFNLSSTVYGTSPFRDTVLGIDSVVLSLAYRATYGDSAAQINVSVAEINQANGFADTTLYRFDNPGFSTGGSLANQAFVPARLRDSVRIGFRTDTVRVANLLRIRLNNSIGEKLRGFDTTATGGYRNDSLFRQRFRGLAVKTTNASGTGALTYFNLTDANTALLVYYRSTRNGVRDTATARFVHNTYSQANSIRRTAGGNYLANLGNRNTQKLYIQSSPTGSYVGMFVPGLSTFPNKIIHRAELVAYRVSADNPAAENFLTPPNRLLLDHKPVNGTGKDTAFLFENDIQPGFDGSLNFAAFGGALRRDDSYRFNITRYVQGIVTRREANDSLRMYAPLRSVLFARNLPPSGQFISVPNLDYIARGRVVVASGNFSDPAKRLRLRIVYSNL